MFGLSNETRVYLKTSVTDGRPSYKGLRGLVSKRLFGLGMQKLGIGARSSRVCQEMSGRQQ